MVEIREEIIELYPDTIPTQDYNEIIKQENPLRLSDLSHNLGDITAGNITLNAAGFIKGGQTSYRTGYGWFEGYSTDTYKFSIKGTSGDEFYFDGVNIGMTSSLFLTGIPEWIASDTLKNSNDTERTTTSTSWVKLKECKLNADLPVCRIKFDCKGAYLTSYTRYQIYKNGAVIGNEQSATDTYATKSEDFTGFVSGDLIQIYARCYKPDAYAVTAYVRNFRFHYGKQIRLFSEWELTTPLPVNTTAISITNQDP